MFLAPQSSWPAAALAAECADPGSDPSDECQACCDFSSLVFNVLADRHEGGGLKILGIWSQLPEDSELFDASTSTFRGLVPCLGYGDSATELADAMSVAVRRPMAVFGFWSVVEAALALLSEDADRLGVQIAGALFVIDDLASLDADPTLLDEVGGRIDEVEERGAEALDVVFAPGAAPAVQNPPGEDFVDLRDLLRRELDR